MTTITPDMSTLPSEFPALGNSGPPQLSPAVAALASAGLPVTPNDNSSAPVTESSAANNSVHSTTASPPLNQPLIVLCSPHVDAAVKEASTNVTVNSTGALDNCASPNPFQATHSSLPSPSLPELSTPEPQRLQEPINLDPVETPNQPLTALSAQSEVATLSSSSSPAALFTPAGVTILTSPRPRRRGTACVMPLALQPAQPFRLPSPAQQAPASDPPPAVAAAAATLGEMFECRLPAQTHDTTSIYIAAQRRQRLEREKEMMRRSSTNVPPTKSCLSVASVQSKSEPTSPTKIKRKVSFADDKGLSLTEVRVMKNEINELPLWTQQLLFQSLPARSESSVISTWDPLFPQPASDYLAFRKRIESNNVALENVIVKKDDDLLTGTIKVKNTAFEKHVFVRATFDCWSSYCDYPAMFVSQGSCPVPALFDTFSFSIKVPASASRYGIIEMCIGYKTPQGEYWDSNGGKNYKLASVTRRTSDNTSPVVAATQVGFIPPVHKLATYSASDIAGWTDFSSWNQILSQGPYW